MNSNSFPSNPQMNFKTDYYVENIVFIIILCLLYESTLKIIKVLCIKQREAL